MATRTCEICNLELAKFASQRLDGIRNNIHFHPFVHLDRCIVGDMGGSSFPEILQDFLRSSNARIIGPIQGTDIDRSYLYVLRQSTTPLQVPPRGCGPLCPWFPWKVSSRTRNCWDRSSNRTTILPEYHLLSNAVTATTTTTTMTDKPW